MLQLDKRLLLVFEPKELCFRSTLGDLTQRPSDMREAQRELAVEVGKIQKTMELCYKGWGWTIPNDLYLGWVHIHTPIINDVPQILNLGHTKSAFLQIGTQIVLSQSLEDFLNMVKVLLATVVEDQDVIQYHHHE